MKIKKEIKILLLITLLAGILRFYKLGTYPPIFNDEIAVGYNAWSILKTGKDEFGVKFPVFFKSFGEGKLPLYVYEAVIPVAIFGLNEFSCRFMPAFLGTLTIFVLYFFVKEVLKLCKIRDKSVKYLPIFSSFLLATMPWHIHFSRGVFGQESLFWVLLGSYLSLKFLNDKKNKLWIFSQLSFVVALMTYHAAKAFVPLWIAGVLIFIWQKYSFKKAFKLGIVALLISGSCFFWMSTSELGNARAKDMSVFSDQSGVSAKLWEAVVTSQGQPVWLNRSIHNKLVFYGKDILQRYFSHFDPTLLFFEGDLLRPRYKIPYTGQLLVFTLPLIILGFFEMERKRIWPVLIFLLLAPIPASLSFETPSTVRAIYMTAAFSIITGLGLIRLFNFKCFKAKLLKISLAIIILLAFLQNFVAYLDAYYNHQLIYNSDTWQQGMEEIVNDVNKKINDYEKVVFTRHVGTPYIFFLFYNHYDPAKWQIQANNNIWDDMNFSFIHIGKMDNIEFIDGECAENLESNNLYLCRSGSQPEGFRIIKSYFWTNGEESFVLGEKKI